jgi:hypothetical protein
MMETAMTDLIDDKTIRRVGFLFAVGVMQAVAVVLFLALIVDVALHDKDDCDKSFWDRCGVSIVTDAKTGKQYLVSPHGGIIERAKL